MSDSAIRRAPTTTILKRVQTQELTGGSGGNKKSKWKSLRKKDSAVKDFGIEDAVFQYRITPSGTKSLTNNLMSERVTKERRAGNWCPPKRWSVFVQWCRYDYIIDPNSNGKFMWDFMIVVGVLWNSVSIPFYLAFADPIKEIIVLDSIYDVFFLIDVFFNFRTAVSGSEGLMITNPAKISRIYRKGWLFLDISAVIPYERIFGHLVSNKENLTLLGWLKTARLLRLTRLVKRYMDRLGNPRFMRLAKLLGGFVFLAHWLACLWSVIVTAGDLVWKIEHGHEESTTFEYYSTCFYSSFVLLVASDIFPVTSLEKLYCISCLIIGAVVYAIIFGNVAMLIKEYDAEENLYREKMDYVQGEMQRLGIKNSTRERVEAYFDHMWWIDRSKFLGSNFIHSLSEPLQLEIQDFLFHDVVEKVDFLRDLDNEDFLARVVGLLVPQIFLMGDMVFRKGQKSNGMYFVSNGEVVVFNGDVIFARLIAGKVFGEVSLMHTDNIRTASCRSTTITDLLFLSKEDFDENLKPFPDVQAKLVDAASKKLARDKQRDKQREGKYKNDPPKNKFHNQRFSVAGISGKGAALRSKQQQLDMANFMTTAQSVESQQQKFFGQVQTMMAKMKKFSQEKSSD